MAPPHPAVCQQAPCCRFVPLRVNPVSVLWRDPMIYGALLWMAGKLQSEQGDKVRTLRAAKGKQAFSAECKAETPTVAQGQNNRV